MQDYINEMEDTRKALNRVRQERDEAENEIDVLKDEVESLNKTLEKKMEDFLKLKEVSFEESLHKKWSFPLRISSVNVTKSHLLKKSLMQNFIFCVVNDTKLFRFNLNVLKQLLERKRTYLENLAENASFTFLACNMNIIVKDFINSIILNLVKSNGHS